MQTIKTNGREIVVLDIPKADIDKKDFIISEHGNLFGVTSYGERMQCNTYLNLTGYKIIGLLSELPIVDVYDLFSLPYKSGKPALLQLNELYNLDTQKPLLIIEKLK